MQYMSEKSDTLKKHIKNIILCLFLRLFQLFVVSYLVPHPAARIFLHWKPTQALSLCPCLIGGSKAVGAGRRPALRALTLQALNKQKKKPATQGMSEKQPGSLRFRPDRPWLRACRKCIATRSAPQRSARPRTCQRALLPPA